VEQETVTLHFLHKMDFCDDQAGIEIHKVNVHEAYISFRFLL